MNRDTRFEGCPLEPPPASQHHVLRRRAVITTENCYRRCRWNRSFFRRFRSLCLFMPLRRFLMTELMILRLSEE
jgi:hypothetical protein